MAAFLVRITGDVDAAKGLKEEIDAIEKYKLEVEKYKKEDND